MVKIKKSILKKLEKRAKEKGKTADQYINYILQQVVERLDKEKKQEEPEEAYTEEDEKKVKERLRSLGYLD